MAFLRRIPNSNLCSTLAFRYYVTIPRITQPKIDAHRVNRDDNIEPRHISHTDKIDNSSEWKTRRPSTVIRAHETQRISIPTAVADRLYKKKLSLIEKKVQVDPRFLGPVLIRCKNKRLNHHVGQKYKGYGMEFLASAHWKKSRYVGDFFTINAVQKNPALLEKSDGNTFAATGLREDICKVLKDYEIKQPTNIQMLTIPVLLEGKSTMCTAETGGGKTLAFVLPMVQKVLDIKDKYGAHRRKNQPLGIILAPSHELADQIYEVTRDLAEPLGFEVRSLVGRYSALYLKDRVRRNMDILIASPGILSKALYLRQINMERLGMIVLDEADTLMDDSFKVIMNKIVLRTTKSAGIVLTATPMEEESMPLEDSNEEWTLHGESWRVRKLSNGDHSKADTESKITNENDMHTEEGLNETLSNHKNEFRNENAKHQSSSIIDSSIDNSQTTDDNHEFIHNLGEENSIDLHNENKSSSPSTDLVTPNTNLTLNNHNASSSELSHYYESLVDNLNDDTRSEEPIGLRSDRESGDQMTRDIRESGLIQFCMVGASIPTSVKELLGDLVPADDVEVIKTDSIHRILPHIVQKFHRVNNDSKQELLLSTVKKNVRSGIPTIVFCNKSSTVRFLSRLIQDCGVKPISALFKISGRIGERKGVFDEWHSGQTDLLVTTDLASRGLDTTRAKVVINYDFPNHMVDYLHRAGRVGRMGSDGTGVVLNCVQHKWDVELCWEIEMAARKGTVFAGVNTNIKRYHEKRHEAKRPNVVELHV